MKEDSVLWSLRLNETWKETANMKGPLLEARNPYYLWLWLLSLLATIANFSRRQLLYTQLIAMSYASFIVILYTARQMHLFLAHNLSRDPFSPSCWLLIIVAEASISVKYWLSFFIDDRTNIRKAKLKLIFPSISR